MMYICQRTMPSVVQIMACRLISAKPLSEQCWHIVNQNLGNKFQWNLNQNTAIFIQENEFENIVCKNGSQFVSASVSGCNISAQHYIVDYIGPLCYRRGELIIPIGWASERVRRRGLDRLLDKRSHCSRGVWKLSIQEAHMAWDSLM